MIKILLSLVITLVPSESDPSCKPDYKRGGFVIHNPYKKAITPTFFCGDDWNKVVVTAPPGDTHVIFMTPEGESQACFVDTWK